MANKKDDTSVLEEGKVRTLKTLSRVLQVFVVIGKVFLIIGLVAVALLAIFTPFVMKDVTVNKEEISFKSKKIELRENENEVIDIYYQNKKVADLRETEKKIVLDLLDQFDAKRISAIIETILMASIIIMILTVIMFSYLATILKNIYEKETPFVEENATLTRRIGFFMIATAIASMICSGIISFIVGDHISPLPDFINISEIMLVFIISYILEYGHGLQTKIDK